MKKSKLTETDKQLRKKERKRIAQINRVKNIIGNNIFTIFIVSSLLVHASMIGMGEWKFGLLGELIYLSIYIIYWFFFIRWIILFDHTYKLFFSKPFNKIIFLTVVLTILILIPLYDYKVLG